MQPTTRRALRLLGVWLPLLGLSLACGTSGNSATSEPDPQAAVIDAARASLNCTAQRFYCDALDRFAAGDAPGATSAAYSLLGLGYGTALGGEEAGWFVARPGELMSVGYVIPESPDETRQVAEVIATLRAGGRVPETHPVAAYVQTLATGGQSPYPTELRGRSRYWRSTQGRDIYVRQNGAELIVIDQAPADIYIAVFRR